MHSKDLIDFVNNPNFIPGIYNYCDRWCERCSFSSRCSVYAMEEVKPDDPETRDITNERFWAGLSEIFQQTKELIVTWAEEHGVELEPLDDDEDVEEKAYKDARMHPLSSAGEAYAFAVSRWFDEEFREIETIADNVESGEEVSTDAERLADAIEVIHWYQFFIAVKTMRGVSSRMREKDYVTSQNFPLDSDGSIKVALIAIDRSISAWRMVQFMRPDLKGSIVPILLRLERLRRETEAEFPLARDFIRAGFDEPSTTVS